MSSESNASPQGKRSFRSLIEDLLEEILALLKKINRLLGNVVNATSDGLMIGAIVWLRQLVRGRREPDNPGTPDESQGPRSNGGPAGPSIDARSGPDGGDAKEGQ